MNEDRIPLARPQYSEAAIAALLDTLRSGWPGPGPLVERFESDFAVAIGAQTVVGLSSGTAALHLAVKSLRAAPGDEVITTPNTFVSTNHVLMYEGLVPVFADIERHTGNIDIESVAQRITPRTRAVMVVHYAGYPCDLDRLYDLAEEHGLEVIEDCAHACGAEYRGRPIGSGPGRCTFSFHPTKNVAAIDGGALTTVSPEEARAVRALRWMGIDKSTFQRNHPSGYMWDYNVDDVGYRYTMSDANAALAIEGLAELEANNRLRATLAERYRAGLKTNPKVTTMQYEPDRKPSNYLFPVIVEQRDRAIEHLRTRGIDAGVHYRSNSNYRMYQGADVPVAEWFSDHAMSLPMYPSLRLADVDKVLDALAEL